MMLLLKMRESPEQQDGRGESKQSATPGAARCTGSYGANNGDVALLHRHGPRPQRPLSGLLSRGLLCSLEAQPGTGPSRCPSEAAALTPHLRGRGPQALEEGRLRAGEGSRAPPRASLPPPGGGGGELTVAAVEVVVAPGTVR